jgi:hypothetical protein
VKLPQARMYYKIAAYGVETMVSERLEDYAFRLHLVGILASLIGPCSTRSEITTPRCPHPTTA